MHNSNPWVHILKAESELNWRYGQAESEIGISSTWNSIVNQAQGVSYFDPWALNRAEQAIEATARLRRIEKALDRMPKAYSVALYGTYGGHRFPPEISKRFGKHTACAIMAKTCDIPILIRLCRIKGHSDTELLMLQKTTKFANQLYTESHLAFLKNMRQIQREDAASFKQRTKKENQ